ncbi:MAG: hypothetical protein KGQ60_00970 [Planctomycetes bacterium]|nr:hypothetical protein [Planctomycetota bacterium]
MLAEFLFTPDALADDDGRNGTDVIRELEQCLFPFRAVPVVLLCNLGDQWERAASRRITRIQNHNHRADAMAMLQKLSQFYVGRPITTAQANTEVDWVNAGLRSISQVPIEKIIVSSNTTPTSNEVVSLKDFLTEGFWKPFENPRLVGRDSGSQEKVLRAICTHSDWMILRLPQIRGGSDDEIVTVKQIVKLSNQLPPGFRKTAIDVQVCMQKNIPEHNLFRGIANELSSFVKQGIQIRLTIWPEKHFVNRELIAGEFARKSKGAPVPKPLWYITMTHVSVGSRDAASAGEAGNTWSLFSREKAFERHTQLSTDTPLRSEILK